jgi:D-alanyl-D-alanine carboxypeptidase/D-alanyl-D-alanine-endopeptidase (penicillin-binding protein 4)
MSCGDRIHRARAALPALLLLCAGAGQAQPQTVLPESVARVLVERNLPAASFSAWAQRIGDPEPLLAFNADVPRNPASVMKLVTTFIALEALGPTYQWRTEVYADGRIAGGTLEGDLLLKGYGDPYLVTERLWLLQRELQQKGIRRIAGDLVIDNSWFAREELDPGAFDGQTYRAYNALPDALLVNFQAVNFIFRPDPARGRINILADPSLPNVEIRNNMRLFRGGCGSAKSGISMVVGRQVPRPRVTFSGALASQCAEYQLLRSVLDAPAYAYGAFRGLWEEQGNELTGGMRLGQVPSGRTPLLVFRSPPLAEVIRSVNKFSNNVMTRQIFLTIAAEEQGAPATLVKGAQAAAAVLARRNLVFPELQIDNGAGLSRTTRITTANIGRLLLAAERSPFGAEFAASLSLAGLDGTTGRRFRGESLAGDFRLKTGTLNDVSAIAGYVRAESGARFAVAIVVNQPRATFGGAQAAQDALLRWVHQR